MGAAASVRVRSAQAASRARDLRPIIEECAERGDSLAQIAVHLNKRGIQTSRGKQWQATQVARVIEFWNRPTQEHSK
jgi:hypothetical protein